MHKHSWLDLELREIELFYLNDLTESHQSDKWRKSLRHYRAKYLREYLGKKKGEFSKINSDLAVLLDQLFTSLLEEYERQKGKLR